MKINTELTWLLFLLKKTGKKRKKTQNKTNQRRGKHTHTQTHPTPPLHPPTHTHPTPHPYHTTQHHTTNTICHVSSKVNAIKHGLGCYFGHDCAK